MHIFSEIYLYLNERHDVIDDIDLTVLQKCIVIVRQLSYDMITDMIHEYLKLKNQHYYNV
jgi:hypothetical protein